ncbi:hypothetical protein QFC19_002636 [Naganishia cerealis]|uniref:Uncharacterized protein n=1 Tax=Naganishia cerealis TaxID=610337 RepID=A0ACC2W8Y0_9TREE|nr:hypothetical protein QFC19_002636 [Naganishia cerealis]
MLTTTKTSVAGYQSSPCVEWGREAPRFYQSRSLQEQAKSRTTEWASEIGSNQCYDHAKAHAFPSVDSASTTQVGASPVSPVSSSSSYSTFPDVNSIHLPTDLNDLKPMTLSPSLQSAAARAPVPISTTTTDISRLAPFKPGVVSSTPLALPGPQELIKSISRNKQGEGGGARSEFGLTTKIVPLPVTTTRPLPLVERNKSYKPPVVTLTAEEYALRPTVTRVSGPGSYVTQHSLRLGAPPPNVLAGGQHLPEHPRMSTSGMPPCTGQLVPMGGITAPVLVSSIPEGYTSVNPGGRSYSEKKLIQCSEKKIQGDFQQSQAAPMIGGSWPTVQRHPLAHLSYIPPGFTSINPPGRSYSEAKRKTTKPQPFARSNDQREGQRRQAAGRNNAVKVGGNERQPAPVVFPFASVGELKTRKGRPPMSKNRNFAEADSPAMRSIQRRETAMESLDMPEVRN